MKTIVFACALVLVAVAGFAQTASDAPASAALSSPSPAVNPGTAAPDEAVLAANRKAPVKASCSATANCGFGTTVSCTSTVTPPGSLTCIAIDRDCSILERGRVSCNGGMSFTYCPKTCNCDEVCVCSVPCSEQCTSGGGFVQDCGSWGFCSTSCACGGECLQPGDDPRPIPNSASSGACATPAGSDGLRAKIFD